MARRGYRLVEVTIFELLGAITILTVLLTRLLPAFQGGHEAARTATCGTNLHQVGAAFSQYANDWNLSLPQYAPAPC